MINLLSTISLPKIKILSFAMGLTLVGFAEAQSGHSIKLKIKGIIPQKTCLLSQYSAFGPATLVEQSQADQGGFLAFKGVQKLEQGMYKITVTPTKTFDIVVTDVQDFSIVTDTTNFLVLTKFYGSPENQLFFDYHAKIAWFKEAQQKADSFKKVDSLKAESIKFRDAFIKKHEGGFANKLIKANVVPIPPDDVDTKGYYQFYQKHYWQNIDLTDATLLKTAILPSKIDDFFDKLTYPSVDSLTNAAVGLIEKTKANQAMYRYMLSTVARKFENPVINGTEGVYVNLAEKYYLTNQAPWLDTYTLGQIKSRVVTMKPLLLGKVFPDLDLEDQYGKPFKISDLKNKYTVVVFYSPTCSHCQATLPKVKTFLDQYASQGAGVLAISVRENGTVWTDFINKYNLSNMTHGWAKKDDSFYYYSYDVAIFPTIYVLNQDSRIIGRKLAGEELGGFVDYNEGK